MDEVLYRYAVKSDLSLVSISDIDEGMRMLEFTCPSCGQELRPRLGKVRSHHFYHRFEKDSFLCNKETYLHWVSKNLLFRVLNERRLANAPYLVHLFDQVDYVDGIGQVVSSELTESLSDLDILETCTGLFLEKESGEFRPDIVVERADGLPIFLEVRVKHASSEEKKRNSIIVEIDVSGESDFARLSDSLGEPRDLLVNFEAFRHVVNRLAPARPVSSVRLKTGRVEEMAALTEFDEAFKNGKLLARLPHDFDGLLGGGIESEMSQSISMNTMLTLLLLRTATWSTCSLLREKEVDFELGLMFD